MRVVTPQITWHNKDPVLCIDIDPASPKYGPDPDNDTNEYYRLATGGADSSLIIWHLRKPNTTQPDLDCVAELTRHNKAVNIVRFNPSGSHIASADDDAYIYIWKNDKNKSDEAWQVEKTLRRHMEDVCDLSWSADGTRLVSASVDNSAVVWDVKKGTPLHFWAEHAGFVQGVSYDPLGEYVATISTDRTLRMFNPKTGKIALKALKYSDEWLGPKVEEDLVPTDENDDPGKSEKPKNPGRKSHTLSCNRIFQDDTLKTYCRRLEFSPRGEFLIVPGGVVPPTHCKYKQENKLQKVKPSSAGLKKSGKSKRTGMEKEKPESTNHAIAIFCRNSFTNPCAVIHTGVSFSVAAKFSPVYYKRNRDVITYDSDLVNPSHKNERMIACVGKLKKGKVTGEVLMDMPYRLVFAVITNNSVIIGDTESTRPLAVVKNIHLARLTDLSWSADGKILCVTSNDGYCSIISFAENELGIPAEEITELSLQSLPILPAAAKPKFRKTPKKKETKKKEPNKTAPKKDPKQKQVKEEEKVKDALDVINEEDKTLTGTVENRKPTTSEKSKDKPPKGKPSTTPQRNTLDKWVIKIKTPNPDESHAPSSSRGNGASSKSKAELKLSTTGSPVVSTQTVDSRSRLKLADSDPSNPSISSDQIRKLESAPIIVDLDSGSEDEPSASPPSSAMATQKLKKVDAASNKKSVGKGTPDTFDSRSNSSPEKVSVGEKRPATSPLSSLQNAKQPRRVQLITLAPSNASGNKDDGGTRQ